MLSTTLRTLRTRWVTFVGTFVALSLGVALIAVMGLALASSLDAPARGPERFAAAPVVVKGQDTLEVPTSIGDRTQRLAQPRAVPHDVVTKLRGLGTVVEDRSFAVRAEGGPADLVGHPWSTAAFAPYELDAGRAPEAADEVAVSGDWARPGTRVRTDAGTVRVVGTVAGRGFENAVFYTDARAADLSPRSLQLVVDADAAAVREAVRGSEGVQVLTGSARRYADPDPDRDGEALTAMTAMFGTAGGVSGFVSVFVVASTFAFAVAQRRREFGLLRTAGATPGQIRRMVVSEALVVGVLASAAGCVLGSYGAPTLAAWAVDESLAPRWFTIGDYTWPYHLAFWTGLLVALCGALAASWRAGRTGPTEALREASVDTGAMTWGRRLSGTALLATAAVTLALTLATDPGDLLQRKTYVSRPMLLISAVALLAPVLVRPLSRLIAWLPAQLPGAGGMLVRENAAAGVRRTAAVAAPVLVTIALAGSLLGAAATLKGAKATEARERTAADFVVTPAGGAGFDEATLRRLRVVSGAEISASSSSAVYVLEDGVALIRSDARAAEPVPLAATARLPLTAGRVSDLDDGSIIVNEEWQRHTVGERVDVWLGDGTRRSLRIAAVMPIGTGDNGVYVTPPQRPDGARRPGRRTPRGRCRRGRRGRRPASGGAGVERDGPHRGRLGAGDVPRDRPDDPDGLLPGPRDRPPLHRHLAGQHDGHGDLRPGPRAGRAPARRRHQVAGAAAGGRRGADGGHGRRTAGRTGRRSQPGGHVERARSALGADVHRDPVGHARGGPGCLRGARRDLGGRTGGPLHAPRGGGVGGRARLTSERARAGPRRRRLDRPG